MTEHLDAAQGSQIADTTCHIEGVEHGGKGTEGIGTRGLNFAHHIHQDSTGLADSHLDLRALIISA